MFYRYKNCSSYKKLQKDITLVPLFTFPMFPQTAFQGFSAFATSGAVSSVSTRIVVNDVDDDDMDDDWTLSDSVDDDFDDVLVVVVVVMTCDGDGEAGRGSDVTATGLRTGSIWIAWLPLDRAGSRTSSISGSSGSSSSSSEFVTETGRMRSSLWCLASIWREASWRYWLCDRFHFQPSPTKRSPNRPKGMMKKGHRNLWSAGRVDDSTTATKIPHKHSVLK